MTSRFWGSGSSGLLYPLGRTFSMAALFAHGEAGAWYDPSDLSTLFQDTGGTTPVTAAGQSVALMHDKSGNANHVSQATAAKMPQYEAAAGLSYLLGDGTDDTLQLNFASAYNQPTTFFAACLFATTTGSPDVMDMQSGAGLQRNQLGIRTGTIEMYASSAIVNFAVADTNAMVLMAEFNGAASTIARDDLAAVTGNPGPGSPSAGSFGLFNVGGDGASEYMNGRIYCCGFINRLLTASEKAGLRTFLGNKAGLVL